MSFHCDNACGLVRSVAERSARPCPRPSAGARVILRWRHAPSILAFRATPSRKVCGRCVRRGALAPDHAQLTAATSVVAEFCPPEGPCQAGERMCVSPGTAWGGRLGHSTAQRWRCHGIGPGHAQDDRGGHVRGPDGSCRGECPRPRDRGRPLLLASATGALRR